jgi:peptide/nickel transport system substrate-binding protein
MITMFYEKASYLVLFHDADTQAYRTDRFTGWTKQPKDTGPVVFTNTSPTYVNLKPISGGGGDSGTSTGLIIGLVIGGLVVLVLAGVLVTRSRSGRDDRE